VDASAVPVPLARGRKTIHLGPEIARAWRLHRFITKVNHQREAKARFFSKLLDGNARRAIDLHEGDKINESAFKEIIRDAVKLNSKGIWASLIRYRTGRWGSLLMLA
jgi:hypothetical protein